MSYHIVSELQMNKFICVDLRDGVQQLFMYISMGKSG